MPLAVYHMPVDDIPSRSITNKSIVLDLDQTLIATQDSMDSLINLGILSNPNLMPLRNRIYHITLEDLERRGEGSKYDYWGITRPHISEFLIFCFSYFRTVGIWTAGQTPYARHISDHIFYDIKPPHIMFTHDDIERDSDYNVIKPLTKMFKIEPNMNIESTFVLDDNITTFSANPDNGILIPAYEPSLNVNAMARDDPSLLQLIYWFLQPDVIRASDVRQLDKSRIFSIPLDTYKKNAKSYPGYTFQ